MKKKNLNLKTVVAVALGGVGLNVQAALVTDTLLTFESSIGCPVGAVCFWNDGLVYGSYYAFDSDGDGVISDTEKTAMTTGMDGGLIIGRTQSAGQIDELVTSFGNTVAHETTSSVNLFNDLGATKELDFTGWNMSWNGSLISLSGDAANFSVDTGLATITCATTACANGDSYILNYAAHIPIGDPSGLGGFAYTLYLEGTISAVPVPAAVWLFGSGLFALMGFARRR